MSASAYTPDRPHDVSQPEADTFGHGDYADALVKALTEAPTPFTVGVFGEWGSGKSTIIAAVGERLKGKADVAFVFFDAWRYEGVALRRQLLRDIARQLDEGKYLGKTFKVGKDLKELDVDVVTPASARVRPSLPIAGLSLGILVVAAGVFWGLLSIHAIGRFFKGKSTSEDAVIVLFSTVFAWLVTTITQPFRVEQSMETTRRLDEPDQFTQKFEQLMRAVKPKRVVVAIDNLDRCSPEHAVEVLSTIKTYLEPSLEREDDELKEAVFLIAADRDALRRHLLTQEQPRSGGAGEADAERYVDEYLRKFFSATIPVRAVLDEDLRKYIAEHLRPVMQAHAQDEEHIKKLTEICAAGLRANPRRIKQFANSLELRLGLLAAREKPGPDGVAKIHPPISNELLMVAKLLLVEEEWPSRFEQLRRAPRLLTSWEQSVLTSDPSFEAPNGGRSSGAGRASTDAGDPRFAAFLRVGADVQTRNIRAFLTLKQSSEEVTLPGFAEFRDAVIVDDRDAVSTILSGEEAEPAEYARRLPALLGEQLQEQYLDGARAVIDIAVSVREFAESESAGQVLGDALTQPVLRGEIVKLSPHLVLNVADRHLVQQRDEVQSLFAAELKRDPAAEQTGPIVAALAAEDTLLPGAHGLIGEAIGAQPELYLEFGPLLAVRPALFTPAVVEKLVGDFTGPETSPIPPGELTGDLTVHELVNAALAHGAVSTEQQDELISYSQRLITTEIFNEPEMLVALLGAETGLFDAMLTGHESAGAEPPSDESVIALLTQIPNLGLPEPPELPARIALLTFRRAAWALVSDPAQRDQIAQTAVTQFFAPDVASAIEFVHDHPDQLSFPDSVANRLLRTAESEPQLAVHAAEALVGAGIFTDVPTRLRDLVNELVANGRFAEAAQVIDHQHENLAYEAGSLVSDLITSADTADPVGVVPLILRLNPYITDDHRDSLHVLLDDLIRSNATERIQAALTAIEDLEQNHEFAIWMRDLNGSVVQSLVAADARQPQTALEPLWTFVTARWRVLNEDDQQQLLEQLPVWLRDNPIVALQIEPRLLEISRFLSADSRTELAIEILNIERGRGSQFPEHEALLRLVTRMSSGRRRTRVRNLLEQRLTELESSPQQRLQEIARQFQAELAG